MMQNDDLIFLLERKRYVNYGPVSFLISHGASSLWQLSYLVYIFMCVCFSPWLLFEVIKKKLSSPEPNLKPSNQGLKGETDRTLDAHINLKHDALLKITSL